MNEVARVIPAQENLTWPQELSHEPTLKIGEVRTMLSAEFPLTTVSKIRHWETLGLVEPHRTASNQRLYSIADVERLRFILQEQRDRFLPLSQISELLRLLDSGEQPEGVHPGRLRAISDDEVRRPQPGTRLKMAEVSDLTGVPVSVIEEMIKAGILSADPRGRLTAQAPEIVRYADMLRQSGFDMRQIRTIRTSAHAHAVMITSAVAAERAKKSTVAGERALTQAAENGSVTANLYRALLAENIEVELR
ncbi:MAG: MerR family transcriptional regulator [Ancrocorticia sp.]|jgi:DNA-binding transcriptional MerR regulator|nr:MerR family transcriptional regulator [Ancrocorticia sp.]MCI2012292.1 MerR family transcriptional regulator [Ancrocorticia sp.]MCI2179042.1 MerR family transcriptional regulator [Ancrocorticia sp.]MCI2192731.1 MerR family transcriptional regulator [Ancrocorticia sp.]MCI2198387.1 MerR family transcriptional regulator [Ancrocorticia sp.]